MLNHDSHYKNNQYIGQGGNTNQKNRKSSMLLHENNRVVSNEDRSTTSSTSSEGSGRMMTEEDDSCYENQDYEVEDLESSQNTSFTGMSINLQESNKKKNDRKDLLLLQNRIGQDYTVDDYLTMLDMYKDAPENPRDENGKPYKLNESLQLFLREVFRHVKFLQDKGEPYMEPNLVAPPHMASQTKVLVESIMRDLGKTFLISLMMKFYVFPLD